MSRTVVNTIAYDTAVDTSGLRKGLTDAENMTNQSGGRIGKALRTVGKVAAAGLAVASAAVIGLARSSVNAFKSLEKYSGAAEVIFGENSDAFRALEKYAKQASRTANMSMNEFYRISTNLGAHLRDSFNGDMEAVATRTNQTIGMIADISHKFGRDQEYVAASIERVLQGNYASLSMLIPGLRNGQQGMIDMLNASGELGEGIVATTDNIRELGEDADLVTRALMATAESQNILGAAAAEAANTLGGATKVMRSDWKNLLGAMGDPNISDLSPFINNMVKSAKTFGEQILPVILSALEGIAELVGTLAPMIVEKIPQLIDAILPPLLEAAVGIVMAIVEMLPSLIKTLFNALVEALPMLINAVVQLIPKLLNAVVDLIITIANELTNPSTLRMLLQAALDMFMALVRAIPDIIVALIDALPDIIANIIEFLTDPTTIMMLIKASVELFMALVKAIPQILTALFGAFVNLFRTLWDRLKGLFSDFAGNFGETIGNVFRNAINGVLGFIEGFINAPINLINAGLNAINRLPGLNIPNIPNVNLPRMQYGGILGGSSYHGDRQLFMGNSGEMVINREDQQALWDFIKGDRGDSGATYNITINGTFATSEAEQKRVAEQILDQVEVIKRQRMGAGGSL